MRILIYTPPFAPMIGGIEAVMETLAFYFHGKGHEVCVLCQAPDDGTRTFPFSVARRPGFRETLRWWRWAEVVIHANVSLKGLLPFLFVHRPWVATHHGWYSRTDRPPNWNAKLKRSIARRFAAANIAVSNAVAGYLHIPCIVIPNPYDDTKFHPVPGIKRDRDVLFVGRLVSDKAPDLLLDAVGTLYAAGLRPAVTITGAGPEKEQLRDQASRLGIVDLVEFTGPLHDDELVRCMNGHHILVVPSTVLEGFGMVAVEGIACGCIVVGSDAGGLPEAIGPCGLTFPTGDAQALARHLNDLLTGRTASQPFADARQTHLSRHTQKVIGDAYLGVLERVSKKSTVTSYK